MLHTIRKSDFSIVLTPNVVVISLEIHPKQIRQTGLSPVKSKNVTNNLPHFGKSVRYNLILVLFTVTLISGLERRCIRHVVFSLKLVGFKPPY